MCFFKFIMLMKNWSFLCLTSLLSLSISRKIGENMVIMNRGNSEHGGVSVFIRPS